MSTKNPPNAPLPNRLAAWILTFLGALHVPLVSFHFFIPSQLSWKTQLRLLTEDNSRLMWGLLLCGIFWLGSMGACTLIEGARRLRSGQGAFPRGLWLWMCAFWVYRIAIQFPFSPTLMEALPIAVTLAPFPALYLFSWWKLGSESTPRTVLGPARQA